MQQAMKKRALELLADGTVARVIGWENGEFGYDVTAAVFGSAEDLEKRFVYNEFCAPNLSKYLVGLGTSEGKTLVFLKPCDTYSFNQLLTEHRISRDKAYVIGIECNGKLDYNKLKDAGVKRIKNAVFDGDKVKVTDMNGEKAVRYAPPAPVKNAFSITMNPALPQRRTRTASKKKCIIS